MSSSLLMWLAHGSRSAPKPKRRWRKPIATASRESPIQTTKGYRSKSYTSNSLTPLLTCTISGQTFDLRLELPLELHDRISTMRATYYLTAAIAATRAALAAPVEHAHAAAAAHTNLVTDEAATNATSLATAIDRRDVDMGINAENKIGKFLTPLAKHIKWYGGPKKESNACYNYYVNGEEPGKSHTPSSVPENEGVDRVR